MDEGESECDVNIVMDVETTSKSDETALIVH